jgi:glutathione synthase/RimK-type ligase-like ATP-grasp enzyme
MQVREYKGLVGAVLTTLSRAGVSVVNPPNDRITDKPSQIALFGAHGLPVPETTTTNNADAAKEFVGSVDEAIYKPTVGGGHADTLEAADLDGPRGEKLANSPVQFQERADGKNIRVFVLDGAVIGVAHVVTEAVDYRSSDHDVEQTTVDPAIEEAAIEATELLDWTFSAVDVMYDEDDDEFVLLEANSSPMFAGFDEHGGLDIAGHLAEYLISEA